MAITIEERVVLNTITLQREAIFKLKESGLARTDIEVIAFGKLKLFFTFADLQAFYCHTNVQQLRRAIQKLRKKCYLNLISGGVKNRPAVYSISSEGIDILANLLSFISNKPGADNAGEFSSSVLEKTDKSKLAYHSFIRHPSIGLLKDPVE